MLHVWYSWSVDPKSSMDWSHHKSFEDTQMKEAKLEVEYLKKQGFSDVEVEQTKFDY